MGLSILLASGGFRIPITKRFCQLLMMYVLLFLTLNRKLEFFMVPGKLERLLGIFLLKLISPHSKLYIKAKS